MRKLYPFHLIEAKWQKTWLDRGAFRASDPGEPGAEKPKYYILDMFPYPSGAGLHVGHPLGYTATDMLARYRRMRGFNVLHPMGWDAFGLPAEQHAIDTGTHPAQTTLKNINTFRRQIQMLGFSYDWNREVDTTDPQYYRWTQWIFLQLFKKGLAYEAEVPVWWCDGCMAVLANEEVRADGTCERKGHPNVYRRPLRQWILKITAYAERLLQDLELTQWPEAIKEQQRNWIGRSEGATVEFRIQNSELRIEVFTTRPDTLFGATYMVLAPEHPLVDQLTTAAQRKTVDAYRTASARKSELERTDLAKEKTGVFTGATAINPVNDEKIPVWVADYVMMGYGTGAIMAVPAHDARDLEFARKFNLPVRLVVQPPEGGDSEGFTGDGTAINSGPLDGLPTPKAKKKITAWLADRGLGKAAVQFKLRDWLFSRQRYWGEPIPIVHCKKCGTVPLPESELPLRLPEMKDYTPAGNAEPPLAKAIDWVNVKCPACGGPATRETNTMPQWAGSCWYYLRFIDPKNDSVFVAKPKEKYWMPVDLYVGGAEHAVLHLLYSRFWHKVLFDLGHVSTLEPFLKLVNQGMILGEDGQKMSKARGNVINPDDVVRGYGADAFRLYEMFLGPLQATKPWSTQGVEGTYRFLGRVWKLFVDEKSFEEFEQAATDGDAGNAFRQIKISGSIVERQAAGDELRLLHKTIRKVTLDLESMSFNTAISEMMIFVNEASKWESRPRLVLEGFLKLLSPFAPHLAEELWQRLNAGRSSLLCSESWPAYDESLLIETEIEYVVQINGKVRARILLPADIGQAELEKAALASEKIQRLLEGRSPKKVIVVPKRLVNIVA